MEQVLCTVAEAKAAARVGHTKFYQLVGEGKIQTVKCGRRRLVLCSSIRDLPETLRKEV